MLWFLLLAGIAFWPLPHPKRTTNRRPDLSIIAPGRRAARMPGTGPLRRSSVLARKKEVLQLCSHPVIGWQDAPPGIFGSWFIQVAAI